VALASFAVMAGSATEGIGLPKAGKMAALNVNTSPKTLPKLFSFHSDKVMNYYCRYGCLHHAVFSLSPKKHSYTCV